MEVHRRIPMHEQLMETRLEFDAEVLRARRQGLAHDCRDRARAGTVFDDELARLQFEATDEGAREVARTRQHRANRARVLEEGAEEPKSIAQAFGLGRGFTRAGRGVHPCNIAETAPRAQASFARPRATVALAGRGTAKTCSNQGIP